METFAKDYIIEALFLLMEKEEYSKISITELCSKAGVSRLSYYRIFMNKDDIVKAFFVQRECEFRLNNHIFNSYGNEVENTVRAAFQGLLDHRKEFDLILKNHLESLYLDYLNEAFHKNFKQMKYDVSELTPYVYSGILYNSSLAWAKNGYQESVDDIAASLCKIMLKQ